MPNDIVPAAIALGEAFGEELTQGQLMASFARTHWMPELEGASTDEEVGRVLLRKYRAGPRMWAGRVILLGLGVLTEPSRAPH